MNLNVKVHAGAKTTAWGAPLADGTLKIQLQTPPEKGKANAALLQFLAKELQIPVKSITITQGLHQSHKRLSIPDHTLLPWQKNTSDKTS